MYARTKLLVPGGGLDALARGRFATGGGGDDDGSTLMGLAGATGHTSRNGRDGRNGKIVPLSAYRPPPTTTSGDGRTEGAASSSRAEHRARVKEEEDLHTANN